MGLARKAIELEPSYAFGQQVYGGCLQARGEIDRACAYFERAVTLDPLSGLRVLLKGVVPQLTL